jgi:hypothetical protein
MTFQLAAAPPRPERSPGPLRRAYLAAAGVIAGRHALLAASAALWVLSLPRIDPDAMSDFGLLSVMPVTGYAALAMLTVSYFVAVREGGSRVEMVLHLAVLVFVLHGTASLVYGTVRYSWAWKHIGIVDFIQRNAMVQPDIAALDVYHNWPSFFGVAAFLTELAGFESAASFAAWAPPVFNALTLGALVLVFEALTADRRVVWTAAWLVAVTNWVGQDYFSPQAFAFFLYLVILGVLLRWFSRRPPRMIRTLGEWLRLRVFRSTQVSGIADFHGVPGPAPRNPEIAESSPLSFTFGAATYDRRRQAISFRLWTRSERAATLCVVLVMAAALLTAHPLTPLMLVAALVCLVIAGVSSSRLLPVVLAGLTAAWMFTGAADFVASRLSSSIGATGSVVSNAGSTFADLAKASASQVVVAWMGRGLVVAVAALGVAGAIRRFRHGGVDLRPIVLVAVPVLLVVGGNYDGEALFRVYLFGLPFAAFLGAHVWFPSPAAGRSRRTTLAAVVTALILLSAFLFAYLGKERQYYFTTDEVAAAEYVYTTAPEGSLLVEGTRNYPGQFVNYERFVYVPIDREPEATHARILADPVAVMDDWLDSPDYPAGYLIITRSQKAEIAATGSLPSGALDRIEEELRASPLFQTVVDTPDAVVFTIAGEAP